MVKTNGFLVAAAICSGVAALLHFGCIIFGGDWYRFFGAGEQMAQMAEAGHYHPTIITLTIVATLTTWSLYALSGAGVILRLPFLRLGLCTIAAIYLLRGIAFAPLMPMFPENSIAFWVVSSAISIVFASLYALGTWQRWALLGRNHV